MNTKKWFKVYRNNNEEGYRCMENDEVVWEKEDEMKFKRIEKEILVSNLLKMIKITQVEDLKNRLEDEKK